MNSGELGGSGRCKRRSRSCGAGEQGLWAVATLPCHLTLPYLTLPYLTLPYLTLPGASSAECMLVSGNT